MTSGSLREVRALNNSAWGFDSQCFVCEPSNARGLGVSYFYDADTAEVRAEVVFGPEHTGAPRVVHGGLVYAVLDEAMAWAAIAIAERFCLVASSEVRFREPVGVGAAYDVRAGLDRVGRRTLGAWAELVSPAGSVCARTEGRLVVMSPEVAAAAIGELDATDPRYLGPRAPEQRE